ncbi:MAG TPA: chitin deacetylase, partial [Candidatus Dormibacteraeota bacterium]|nr:chitin deacetylase [Candidatus Dormibacteraeota bacterium]
MRRRQFLKTIAVGSASALGHSAFTRAQSPPAPRQKALIAITLDLEMARNFPHWEDTHWDYEKGNLQPEMK